MAYVQPNSTIEFFSDLNLSDKYTDSLYFASVSAKDTYFTNLTKVARVLTCTYTRENRGYVRVEVPMATLIGATYMRFKNTSFENKWFYAFVDKVDYVNNQTTEVKFTIDPLMTWMGTFTLNECFIERQHTVNDGIGNNIAEEGIPIGEYVIERSRIKTFGQPCIALVYIPDDDNVSGDMMGGVYSACTVEKYRITEAAYLNAKLKTLLLANKLDNVVNIFMCYTDLVDNKIGSVHEQYPKPYSSLNGYVPRNNKLYCYPYKKFVVDNMEGGQKEYMYEYFNSLPDATSSGTYDLDFQYAVNAKCELVCIPEHYKGDGLLLAERISKTHFPQCAFASNTYEAYLAQKNAFFMQETVKGGVKGAIKGAMGGFSAVSQTALGSSFAGGMTMGNPLAGVAGVAAGAIGGGLLGVADSVADHFIENGIKPETPMRMSGDQSVDILYANYNDHFTIYEMCISKNYAMMLDSYFDMFGYAIREHGVPNMNARPNWTFVKTIGCNVGGAIPADDASVIEAIFDNGIRFWKNHNNIGNYSLNNAPA